MHGNDIACVCIMADVISSRSESKMEELNRMIDKINNDFDDTILTRFVIRNGDEMFGILRKISASYGVLKLMFEQADIINLPLYVGIGIGYVEPTNINNPHMVNGSAIWSAADSLKAVKSKKVDIGKHINLKKTFQYNWQTADEIKFTSQLLNYHVYFLFERMQKRTDKQREVIRAIETSPNKKVQLEIIGEQIGYDANKNVNVSKMLQRADYHLISEAEQGFVSLLDYLQNQMNKGR